MTNIERIRISTSDLTNTIYVGRVNVKEDKWLEKRDCTDEALCAVRDHLVGMISESENNFGYEWSRKDGKTVELRVSIKDEENHDKR